MRNTFRLTHQIFPRTLSNKISSTDGQQTEKQFHIRQQRYRLLNHARETINSIDSFQNSSMWCIPIFDKRGND